ncbi:MAG: RluA family pseudouridine synthase [Thermodesulfobacteriota bacterium]
MTSSKRIECRLVVNQGGESCNLLAEASGLPKGRIKVAMAKGAVWLNQSGKKERRLRKAKFRVVPGDRLQLCYDPDILALNPPRPLCLDWREDYSLWYKPPWLLTQGSRYGDHCSLLYLAQKEKPHTQFKLIHRLDREAAGLVVLAHHRQAAAALSELLKSGGMEKRYLAGVSTVAQIPGDGLVLDTPLDGKASRTEIIRAVDMDSGGGSFLDIRLHSGRQHQIRRHLSQWGHPIMGDPQYGDKKSSKSNNPMMLWAWGLRFECPLSKVNRRYTLPAKQWPSFLPAELRPSW